jgi:HrpA-like RNA helicase
MLRARWWSREVESWWETREHTSIHTRIGFSFELVRNLPVSQQIPRLLPIIKQYNIVVVVGETGTGKTTQLPKAILLDDEWLATPGTSLSRSRISKTT